MLEDMHEIDRVKLVQVQPTPLKIGKRAWTEYAASLKKRA
jgi:hypothetical protein